MSPSWGHQAFDVTLMLFNSENPRHSTGAASLWPHHQSQQRRRGHGGFFGSIYGTCIQRGRETSLGNHSSSKICSVQTLKIHALKIHSGSELNKASDHIIQPKVCRLLGERADVAPDARAEIPAPSTTSCFPLQAFGQGESLWGVWDPICSWLPSSCTA